MKKQNYARRCRGALGVILAAMLFAACATPRDSGQGIYVDEQSHAVEGADVVAYFELPRDADAVFGRSEHSRQWMGATWLTASEEHLSTFRDNPQRYAPAFGGYCSMAMAQGNRVASDPQAWTVYRGQLYLFARKQGRADWREAPERFIARAEENWETIRGELVSSEQGG